jgi:polyisoprenoid-binding protein YceI
VLSVTTGISVKTEATTVQYAIDAGMSRFTVQAFASGWLSAFAHHPLITVRQFSGEARFDPDALERSSLVLRIDSASSLEVTGNVNDKDRPEIQRTMRDEVLEIDRFPEIVYECSHVSANRTGEGRFWVTLNGELSLHGVTRPQPVSASVARTDDLLRANGSCSLKQTDYDIKLVSALGGGVKVKDELKLSFDIVAKKTP